MPANLYLTAIFISALTGWISWFIVLYKLSPFVSSVFALAFFYISLFIALGASFTLTGYYARKWISKEEYSFKIISVSIRQGGLLSLITCVSLVFQRMRVLTWWDGLLLLATAVLIEFYFISK